MVLKSTPAAPAAKKINAAQNAPIARYIWKMSVYADENRPPAKVYTTAIIEEISIAQKKSIGQAVERINPEAAKFPATSTMKLIVIRTDALPSAPVPRR